MKCPAWELLHPNMTAEALGILPSFLDEDDPRSAKEQLDANYQHGGGWRQFDGLVMNADCMSLSYPGDPDMPALAQTKLRNERIILFECSWVAVVQPTNPHGPGCVCGCNTPSYEIARMD